MVPDATCDWRDAVGASVPVISVSFPLALIGREDGPATATGVSKLCASGRLELEDMLGGGAS